MFVEHPRCVRVFCGAMFFEANQKLKKRGISLHSQSLEFENYGGSLPHLSKVVSGAVNSVKDALNVACFGHFIL